MGCFSCGKKKCECGGFFSGSKKGCEKEFRRILSDLRGGGFNTSITLRGGTTFNNQKVVAFEDGVVFTVNNAGLARAFCIERIDAVDF